MKFFYKTLIIRQILVIIGFGAPHHKPLCPLWTMKILGIETKTVMSRTNIYVEAILNFAKYNRHKFEIISVFMNEHE